MKSFIKKLFLSLILLSLFASTFLIGILYGIDREVACQEYQRYVNEENYTAEITGCIFQSNCDYYNDLLLEIVD